MSKLSLAWTCFIQRTCHNQSLESSLSIRWNIYIHTHTHQTYLYDSSLAAISYTLHIYVWASYRWHNSASWTYRCYLYWEQVIEKDLTLRSTSCVTNVARSCLASVREPIRCFERETRLECTMLCDGYAPILLLTLSLADVSYAASWMNVHTYNTFI